MAEAGAFEQYLLELVNRARASPAAEASRLGIELNQGLAPGAISAAPKPPLAMNTLLVDAARAHSAWMLEADTFSHTGSGGSTAGQRMTDAGYVFSGSWSWGENIAWRSGTPSDAVVLALHDALVRSPGHRVNLMNEGFREVGLGLVKGDFASASGTFASTMLTEKFARSGSAAFLVGVVFDDRDGDRAYDPGEGLGGVSIGLRDMAGGATLPARSGGAGGYQVALAPGTYEVTFSGGGLAAPVVRSIAIGSQNVKLDLDSDVVPAGSFSITRGGVSATEPAQFYTGPVTHLQFQLLGSAGGEAVAGTDRNDFMNLLGGDDAAHGGGGDDVLDGGTGSNFLTGGAGWDVFFLDGRGGAVTWATITDWTAGEHLSLWGWRPGVSRASWVERAGAPGWEGVTLHGDLDGNGQADTSVTWAGRSRAALPTPVEGADLLWFR